MFKRSALLIMLVVVVVGMMSCVAGDSGIQDSYLGNLFPGVGGKWLGSANYPWHGVVADGVFSWNGTAYALLPVVGVKGDTGATGAKGDKGDKGDTGDAGFGQGVRVWNSVSQSINSGSWTSVQFNTAKYDSGGMWSSSNNIVLTATVAGKYLIVGQVAISMINYNVWLQVTYNGTSTSIASVNWNVDPVNGTALEISTIYSLGVSDYVILQIYQNTGVGKSIVINDARSPAFMMQRIGN